MSQYESFFAWSIAMTGKENLAEYEEGDKIILPQSFLLRLKPKEDGSPFYFKITNSLNNDISTYVGVLEFSAMEGNCHLPYWLMEELLITEGNPVKVELVPELTKATSVKFRPQNKDFFNLVSNPKAWFCF